MALESGVEPTSWVRYLVCWGVGCNHLLRDLLVFACIWPTAFRRWGLKWKQIYQNEPAELHAVCLFLNGVCAFLAPSLTHLPGRVGEGYWLFWWNLNRCSYRNPPGTPVGSSRLIDLTHMALPGPLESPHHMRQSTSFTISVWMDM